MSTRRETDITTTSATGGSPIGARRTRTDLKTSENVFLAGPCPKPSRSRSRNSTRGVIRQYSERRQNHLSQQQQQQQQLQQTQHCQQHHELQQQHDGRTNQSHLEKQLHFPQHRQQHVAFEAKALKRNMLTEHGWRQQISGDGNVAGTSLQALSSSAPTNGIHFSSKLPACATRLLNRTRLHQQQPTDCSATGGDSDSSRSTHSLRRNQSTASRGSAAGTGTPGASATTTITGGRQRNQTLSGGHHNRRESQQHSSSDDLMLYDKSFRNAMIHDVLQFKKQLLRLRRILQEDDDCSSRTETLNPFENDNVQLFATCGLDSKLLTEIDLASLTSSTTDDPIQELTDMRRQVVYLQGQVDDRDRTIRIQRDLIEKLEAEKRATTMATKPDAGAMLHKECINTATQTERTRPLSLAAEGLSRSKPEYTSYTTYFPLSGGDSTTMIHEPQQLQHCPSGSNKTRRHTIISTTLTNYNNNQLTNGDRRASIAFVGSQPNPCSQQSQQHQQQQLHQETPQQMPMHKSVRITLIGDPLKPLTGNGYNGYLNGCRNGQQEANKYKSTGSVATQKKDATMLQQQQHAADDRAVYREAKAIENGFKTFQHYYLQQPGQTNGDSDHRFQQSSHVNCQQHNNAGHTYPTVTIV